MTANLHILWTTTQAIRLERVECPTCRRGYRYGRKQIPPRQAHPFAVLEFQDWFGWRATCLRCGERWEGGWRLARPFEPGWREARRERARKRWRHLRDRKPRDPVWPGEDTA